LYKFTYLLTYLLANVPVRHQRYKKTVIVLAQATQWTLQ